MADIAKAYVQIIPSTEGVQGSLESAFGAEADKAGKTAGSKLSNALGGAAKVGIGTVAALGTAVVGTGAALASSASATAQFGDNIDKMSQKLGVSSSFYQEWDAVLQHSGSSMDAQSATFKKLANAAQDAGKDQVAAFEAVGLSMEQVQSMSTEDLFTAVITGLQGMEEGTERTALATDLLGRGAMELGPLLNTSAEDTQAMIDTVNDLGGVMSETAVKDAAAFQDQLQDMQTAFTGIKNGVVSELLPSFTSLMGGFTEIMTGGDQATVKLQEGVAGLSQSLVSAIPQVVSGFSTALGAIVEVAPELLSTLAQSIIDNVPVLLPSIVDLVVQIGTMLVENLPMLIESAMQIIVQLAIGIAQALPDLIPTIVEVVLTIVEYLIDNIDLLIDAAIQLMIGLADGLIQALPILIEKAPIIISKLVSAIIENAPKIFSAGINLIMKLGEGFSSAIPTVLGKIKSFANDIKEAFLSKVKDFVGIGADIINGIKEGISNSWDNLKDWFGEIMHDWIDSIKDFFKIGSPSKLMANEVGRWLPAGVAQGIEDGMGIIDSAIDDMNERLMGGAYSASATMSASMSADRMYSSASATTDGNSSVAELLATYLPMIASGENLNVTLEGDANRLFRVMQSQAVNYQRTTGQNAFA